MIKFIQWLKFREQEEGKDVAVVGDSLQDAAKKGGIQAVAKDASQMAQQGKTTTGQPLDPAGIAAAQRAAAAGTGSELPKSDSPQPMKKRMKKKQKKK